MSLQRSESLAQLAAAMARARMKFQPLGKDREAKIASRSGTSYSYDYADLADSYDAVMAALNGEGIAVFQPPAVENGHAIVTTLLVHESGEWLQSPLALPIVDSADARAVGSALTYAKRYALQGMVAIAPKDEDDDGEKARGGNHEMASGSEQVREPGHHPVLSPGRQAGSQCPACKRDAIIKSRAEYGGGWLCHKKRGGCGMRWPEDAPLPLTADESVPF